MERGSRLKAKGKQELQSKNETPEAARNSFGLVLSGFDKGATRQHKVVMDQLTLHIVNLAQEEHGRFHGVLRGKIRFVFPSKEHAIRFMQAVHDDFPSVNLQACSEWKRVDVQNMTAAA